MMRVLEFVQNELLGMRWLDRRIGDLLMYLGFRPGSPIEGSIRFFVYDVIKISILLGLLIFTVSYIQSYFPPERSRSIMTRFRGLSANFVAALLGTVTPFCSCSSIPLFMGFTRAGLPLGVTFSFLISSPMVDLGSLALLTGIFGLRVAAVYVVIGLLIAVFGGSVIEKLGMEDEIEDDIRAAMPSPGRPKSPEAAASKIEGEECRLAPRERFDFAVQQVGETFRKVFPYLVAGVGIGALIHNWIPEVYIESVLGSSNPLGVLLAVLVGAPMYADIFGTIPVAEALLGKGALLGTVLSFMMAVTTLSLPSLIMLRKAIKPKLLALFVAVCSIGMIAVGYFFNAFAFIMI